MFSLDAADFVSPLQIQPELFCRSEKARQTDRCIGADTAPFQNDIVDARRRDAESLRQFVNRHPNWRQELLSEDFAGMNSPVRSALSDNSHLSWPSMVVRDLHFISVVALPNEADSVLVVDPNAVLPLPVATQFF